MILAIHDNWEKAKTRHDAYLKAILDTVLVSKTHTVASPRTLPFLEQIQDDLLDGSVDRLRNTIAAHQLVEAACADDAERAEFRQDLEDIFDYSGFISKNKAGWNAYELCKLSKYRTCPYCNQAYAFTVVQQHDIVKGKTVKSFRPTLDHFLPKSRFPHLAISLNNLVPSCSICNSSLKGSIDFHAEEHLHPFEDAESISFSLADSAGQLVDLRSNIDKDNHQLTLQVKFSGSCVPSTNSVKTFLVRERYEMHVAEAVEFAVARLSLSRLRAREIGGLGLGNSEVHLLRFDPANYRNVILGKMLRDLHAQLNPNP